MQSPPKAYLELSRTSKMELLGEWLTALSIFTKSSILDVLLASKYAPALYPQKSANVPLLN